MTWIIHADQFKSRKALAVPLNEDAYGVLMGQQGRHPEPVERTSTKAWSRTLERAGVINFRWHDLRHIWALWHVQRETSLYELMELGSWSSLDMVLRYAQHMAGEY